MTQDEIIEMAIEAEFVSHGKPSDEESELFVCVDKDIYKFAKLVAEKERTWVGLTDEDIQDAGRFSYCRGGTSEKLYYIMWNLSLIHI
jgi:hypothetical protein